MNMKRCTDKIIESGETYQSLFNVIIDGIFLHKSGEIIDVNLSFLTMFGYEQEEKPVVIGMPALRILAKESHKTAVAILNSAEKSPGSIIGPFELLAKKKDDSLIHVEIYSKPYIYKGCNVRLVTIRNITMRKRTEEQLLQAKKQAEEKILKLEKTKQEMMSIINSLQDVFYKTDLNGNILWISPAVEAVFGYTIEEMLGKDMADFYANPDERKQFLNLMKSRGNVCNYETQIKHKNGTNVWISISAHFYRDEKDKIVSIVGIGRDITERKQTEIALRKSEERYRELFDNANDMVITIDLKGNITSVNKMGEEISGYSIADLIGKHISCLLNPLNLKTASDMIEQKLKGVAKTVYDLEIISKDGRITPAEISSNLMFQFGKPIGVQAFVRDISKRKKLEDTLREMSFKDGLTGLANRRHFDEVLNKEWKRAMRENNALSLILLDIDSFKSYNDHYGHQKGDACLKTVSSIISQSIKRPGDLAARYGGEEFALLLSNAASQDAYKIANEIRQRVQVLKIPHEGSKVADCRIISISAGVATMLHDQLLTPSILISLADKALYSAKKRGRNQVALSE